MLPLFIIYDAIRNNRNVIFFLTTVLKILKKFAKFYLIFELNPLTCISKNDEAILFVLYDMTLTIYRLHIKLNKT